jgi:hypothetical protein
MTDCVEIRDICRGPCHNSLCDRARVLQAIILKRTRSRPESRHPRRTRVTALVRTRKDAPRGTNCGIVAFKSTKQDHTAAPIANERSGTSARDRVSQSNACSWQARQCGCQTLRGRNANVCVCCVKRGPLLGGLHEGRLAAVTPAVSGALRTGRGFFDRRALSAICPCRARRRPANAPPWCPAGRGLRPRKIGSTKIAANCHRQPPRAISSSNSWPPGAPRARATCRKPPTNARFSSRNSPNGRRVSTDWRNCNYFVAVGA